MNGLYSQWPANSRQVGMDCTAEEFEPSTQTEVQTNSRSLLLSSRNWWSQDYHAAAHRQYLQLEKSYFLLQKYLGILFCENKNSLAPRWHDKFLPKPYVDIFEKTYTYDTCSSIEHYQIVCDPFEIHFMLLRSRSRTLLMLFPLLGILYIYRCCFI